MWYEWRPYISVSQRRRNAERHVQKLKKKGHILSPVHLEGRTIARTFWGRSWCENLEGYSDFENRLPRGRAYVRNGSVLDLQIASGVVSALVSGSDIYTVEVKVSPVPKTRWKGICKDCAGAIDSVVELLQGRFSKGVMERICQQRTGLFPSPQEIEFACSCPDWASMCKHVAAVLYGIGARLDDRPELLFLMRKVDEKDLIAKAGKGMALSKKSPAADKLLDTEGLSEMFGIEMQPVERRPSAEAVPRAAKKPSRAAEGRKSSPPKASASVAADKRTTRNRTSINYPKCAYPRCGNNRYARGHGFCGAHWKQWLEGKIRDAGSYTKKKGKKKR